MSKVVADITMSLDGFVTGPDPGPERGLGRGGEPLHAWVKSDHEVDKDVIVMGGGDVIRQCVDAGLADELTIHLAPILLGSGTPLLADCHHRQLVQRNVRISPTATHLTYTLHT